MILADRFGPEILTILEIKGHYLRRLRVHLKVPGWSCILCISSQLLKLEIHTDVQAYIHT